MPLTETTLQELLTEMGQRWAGTPFWTDDDALQAINEALRFWNLLTGQWKGQVALPTSTSFFYTVPTTLTFQFRVTWNGIPLQPTSIRGLDLGSPNWRNQTVSTGNPVPARPTRFAPCGLKSFAIWPKDVVLTNSLIVEGVTNTPVLVNPGDFLDLGDEERDPILKEALHVASFKVGGAIWKKTFAFHQAFLLAAVDRNSRLKADTLLRRIAGFDFGRPLDPLRLPVSPEALKMFQQAAGQGG